MTVDIERQDGARNQAKQSKTLKDYLMKNDSQEQTSYLGDRALI